MLSMAAVVASEVASVLGTFFPMTPPMAPPSGYQTPPVPPVTMLKENLSAADPKPGNHKVTRASNRVARSIRSFTIHLRLLTRDYLILPESTLSNASGLSSTALQRKLPVP